MKIFTTTFLVVSCIIAVAYLVPIILIGNKKAVIETSPKIVIDSSLYDHSKKMYSGYTEYLIILPDTFSLKEYMTYYAGDWESYSFVQVLNALDVDRNGNIKISDTSKAVKGLVYGIAHLIKQLKTKPVFIQGNDTIYLNDTDTLRATPCRSGWDDVKRSDLNFATN